MGYMDHLKDIDMGNDRNNEENILRVSGSSSPGSLAAAISHAVYDSQQVILRCIGAASVNQAIKGVAIAQGYVGQRGLTLSIRPGFTTIKMPSGEEVSAIVLRVFVG